MTEELVYVDAHETEPEKMDEYVKLLYSYLHHYISEEELRGDVKYCFEKGRVVGAYEGKRLVGAVAGAYTPFFEDFHIAHLAVETSHRKMGIGLELMERVVPEGKSASVHLNVENPSIQRFYEHIGYRPTHIRFRKDPTRS